MHPVQCRAAALRPQVGIPCPIPDLRHFRTVLRGSGQGHRLPHILPAMAESSESDIPSLETLAQRYLDLWQEQWAACAADPEMADAAARLFQMMAQGAATMAPFVLGPGGFAYTSQPGSGWNPTPGSPPPPAPSPPAQGAPRDRGQPHDSSEPRPPAGAAAPGAASGDGGGDTAQLLRRIAALEERLAAMEAASAGPGGGSAPADRRNRRGRLRPGG